jgi:hypothetical protein
VVAELLFWVASASIGTPGWFLAVIVVVVTAGILVWRRMDLGLMRYALAKHGIEGLRAAARAVHVGSVSARWRFHLRGGATKVGDEPPNQEEDHSDTKPV